ncbi:MAG: flagellar motor switch protein FliN [Desulfobacterales bacterium]|jgi:flagellar motor switch protein FliN/FliY
MDLILDLPLDVSVELGKVKMPVNELLQLGRGSILELTKPVGEPLDIYINNKLIAKGEVVILDDKFGVRVADIINPVDRVKSLG